MQKIKSDVNKLKMMSPMSAEASVLRNYIDVLVNVPWKKKTKVTKDLIAAEKVLEDDHHGLEKVKERILEYLAVQQRISPQQCACPRIANPPTYPLTHTQISLSLSPSTTICNFRFTF